MIPGNLTRKSLAAFAATALAGVALLAASLTAGGATESSADTSLDTEEQAFITLLNNYRSQNGLGPLIMEPTMQNAAEWMNTDMGTNRYFSHTDSLGRSPWTRMCDFGYCYNTYKAENIAAGYTTGAAVFEGWRTSPGHNANMLGANYRVIGLSRVYVAGSPYGWYWTNDFGGYITANSYPPQGPTNTPAPTNSPTPAPTAVPPTASPTKTPSPTPSPMASPTPSPTTTPTPTPTAVPPTASPTKTPSPTPTASPTPTPTVVPPTASPSPTVSPCEADTDCDGFEDGYELYIGTNPYRACAQTSTANDETTDANPTDMNDDRRFNTLDAIGYVGHLNSIIGQSTYDERLDSNVNGMITTLDLVPLALKFNTTCS